MSCYLETRQQFLKHTKFNSKNIQTESDFVFAIKHAIPIPNYIVEKYIPNWLIDWLPNARYAKFKMDHYILTGQVCKVRNYLSQGYYPSPTIATSLINTYPAQTLQNNFLDVLTLLTTFGIYIDFRYVMADGNMTAKLLLFLECNYNIPPEVVYRIILAEKTYDQIDKFEKYGYHSKFLIHSSILTKSSISGDYKINLLEDLLDQRLATGREGLKQNLLLFEFPEAETDENALRLCVLLCKFKLPITLNLIADAGKKGLWQTYNYLTTLLTKVNVPPKNLPPLNFLAQCEQAIATKKFLDISRMTEMGYNTILMETDCNKIMPFRTVPIIIEQFNEAKIRSVYDYLVDANVDFSCEESIDWICATIGQRKKEEPVITSS